ncbi:MAG TPA: protein translocase subunit SecDF [Lachnoclostridium sp.]|jgi:SecD/SecF fusion protein|uniref:protein translocase subunit SecD n=1 Tax=Lacrimispora sp. TaxID=2719234 RepID=UPI000ECB0D3A|nr:protein translocase subunit SecD [Lacrimispora sp.]HCD44429.1 protein translocase subunit SecDF [Lachnoclostridium sp.]
MKPGKKMIAAILVVVAALIYVAAFGAGSSIKGVREMRYGIDIRGGVEAVFEPQGLDRNPSEKELDTARQVIETRMDNQNIVDREVTVDKNGGYIIVRFPWKSGETNFNPEEAIAELGEMAELTFRDPDGNVLIQGKDVQNATPETANNNGIKSYQVALSFNAEGARLFEEATGKLIGKRMSIYMDQDLISSPTVQTKISGGQAVITGMQDYDDAKNLAEKINAGSLPFSLKTTNFSTISPSLGNNALAIMVYAGMAAFLVICLFMLVFYKLPGAVACVTLVLQTVLQMLAVSIPQYTLTLPGIAGIILTIGMAVDTNIIISERISDELKKGISVKGAILTGYKNAFSSVLDGNVTTAIVAVILMFLGSGTMLSFGYTLLIGMIVNLLVGVTVSKQLLLSLTQHDLWRDEKWFRIRKDKKIIPFYQKKYIYGIISGLIFFFGIVGCFIFGVKLDTQFTGGAVLSYSVSDEADTGKIQSAIEKQTNRPVTVQIKEDNMTGLKRLSVTLAGNSGMSPEDQKDVTDAINSTSEKVDAKLSETYVVEPYIGAKALKNAVVAILLSLLFIVIYVWIRFSAISGLPAGVTAMIALVHDVVVVFFAFVLFRIPLNDAFVAVVLTIIGYSINDTIVIYDRIRENRKKDSKMPVDELVNISTSQTLGRSINTSCTTGICVLIILAASVYFQIGSILEFSLPMFFGILTGCYSSICVAGTLWAMWEKKKEIKK